MFQSDPRNNPQAQQPQPRIYEVPLHLVAEKAAANAPRNRAERHIALIGIIALLLLFAFVVAGCNEVHNASLVNRVPDNAVVIKRVDFDRLLHEAGLENADVFNPATAPMVERLVELTVSESLEPSFTALLKARNEIDWKHLVSFTNAQGYDMAMVPILAPAKDILTLVADKTGDILTDGEFAYVEVIDYVIAVSDGICYLAPTLPALRSTLDEASHNNDTWLVGIHQFLEDDGDIAVAINCDNSPLSIFGDAEKWLCIQANISDNAVTAEARLMDRDGKLDSIGRDFGVIDTNFLRYTPGDAAVVLAFGKFTGNDNFLQMLFGIYTPENMEWSNGTTSLSAVPIGNVQGLAEGNPAAWNVQTMVHLPQQILDESLEAIGSQTKATVKKVGDNEWSYTNEGRNYYFGAFDGSLTFASNSRISPNCNNSFTENFLGKRAALLISIPYGSDLAEAWGMKYGATLSMELDALKCKGEFTFTGSGSNAFISLLNLPQFSDLYGHLMAVTGR